MRQIINSLKKILKLSDPRVVEFSSPTASSRTRVLFIFPLYHPWSVDIYPQTVLLWLTLTDCKHSILIRLCRKSEERIALLWASSLRWRTLSQNPPRMLLLIAHWLECITCPIADKGDWNFHDYFRLIKSYPFKWKGA